MLPRPMVARLFVNVVVVVVDIVVDVEFVVFVVV